MINIEEKLAGRINLKDIRQVVDWAQENENRKLLWELVASADRRTGANALWVMTHFPECYKSWIISLRDEMINRLLNEKDSSKKRLFLQLLRDQEYEKDFIRSDFLDFCLSKINSECEPYAIRCLSLYLSFKMCRHYPELIDELEEHLNMMSFQVLSPGLKSAHRKVRERISLLKKGVAGKYGV